MKAGRSILTMVLIKELLPAAGELIRRLVHAQSLHQLSLSYFLWRIQASSSINKNELVSPNNCWSVNKR